MGLYERLLKESEPTKSSVGVERCLECGMCGSKVLVRRAESASERIPGHAADLSMMHRLITKGPCDAGEGMRLESLKAKCLKEYGEVRAEAQG